MILVAGGQEGYFTHESEHNQNARLSVHSMKTSGLIMKKSNTPKNRNPLAASMVAIFFRSVAITALCAGTLWAFQICGATLSWSGGGGGANWNDSGNWGFAGTPTNGDTLIFPAAQPRQIGRAHV